LEVPGLRVSIQSIHVSFPLIAATNVAYFQYM
jgi:hypothetical protein